MSVNQKTQQQTLPSKCRSLDSLSASSDATYRKEDKGTHSRNSKNIYSENPPLNKTMPENPPRNNDATFDDIFSPAQPHSTQKVRMNSTKHKGKTTSHWWSLQISMELPDTCTRRNSKELDGGITCLSNQFQKIENCDTNVDRMFDQSFNRGFQREILPENEFKGNAQMKLLNRDYINRWRIRRTLDLDAPRSSARPSEFDHPIPLALTRPRPRRPRRPPIMRPQTPPPPPPPMSLIMHRPPRFHHMLPPPVAPPPPEPVQVPQIPLPFQNVWTNRKISLLYVLIQMILSSLVVVLAQRVVGVKANERTFGWGLLMFHCEFFLMLVPDSSIGCVKFRKAFAETANKDGLRIRPEFNYGGQCVVDKELTVCPFGEPFTAVSVIALVVLPNVIMIIGAVHTVLKKNITDMGCYQFITRPLIWIYGLINYCLLPFILLNTISILAKDAERLESDFMHGRNFMSPPQNISPIWEITQRNSQCCGIHNYTFWDDVNTKGHYPMSCCNNLKHECTGFPNKDQVWQKGCSEVESNKYILEKWVAVSILPLLQVIIAIRRISFGCRQGLLWCWVKNFHQYFHESFH